MVIETEDIIRVNTKYTRGKEILLEYVRNYGTGHYSKIFDDYVESIIDAISSQGYEAPIPVWRMCQALEVAEKRNKHISIHPAPEFLSGNSAKKFIRNHPNYPPELVGIRAEQHDGWRYIIEYI